MTSLMEVKKRILSRVDLVKLIGESVALQDRSGKKVGLCPFHEENGPSFTLYADHYYCYGCHESGDAITFVRKMQGLDFIAALKFLAAKFGVDTPELQNEQQFKKERTEEAALFSIMLAAQSIFVANLTSPAGTGPFEYLLKRGFSKENIQSFGFGLAFDEPIGLLAKLRKQGFQDSAIEACSLTTTSAKNGQYYDFYRNRITIPIHDAHNRLIAFGGRALDDFGPKYKNSRDTRLFDKSSTLFGLHRAKESMRKGAPAIVVEGYMDVLQLWQNGFNTAVACMGTALKKEHLRAISNLTHKVILLFDGDSAGQKASLATVTQALEFPELSVKVAVLPSGDDPDSYAKKNGAQALQLIIDQATDLLDFAIKSKLLGANANNLGLPELLRREILPWLARIEDRLKQGYLVGKLSEHSGINKADLDGELRQIRAQLSNPANAKKDEPLSAKPSATKPSAQRGPIKKLSHLEYEILAHLYFAESQDQLDLVKIETFVKSELDLDGLWLDLVEDLFTTLKRNESPRLADKNAWSCATDPLILKLFNHLEAKAGAFATPKRSSLFERLLKQHLLTRRRQSVSQLKSKLASADPSEVLTILKSIATLNSEIGSIEMSLK